jgi:hypothetical protein
MQIRSYARGGIFSKISHAQVASAAILEKAKGLN